MSLITYGVAGFLTFAFASAFVAAALAGFLVRSQRGIRPAGLNPLLVLVPMALVYYGVLNEMISLAMTPRMMTGPLKFRAALVLAWAGVAVATALVAWMGGARRILGASYLATALSSFILPFVGRSTTWIDRLPGLFATLLPAALGFLFCAMFIAVHRRESLGYRKLSATARPETSLD